MSEPRARAAPTIMALSLPVRAGGGAPATITSARPGRPLARVRAHDARARSGSPGSRFVVEDEEGLDVAGIAGVERGFEVLARADVSAAHGLMTETDG